MKTSYLKIWIILSVILAVTAVIIRSIWQIVVIPTSGTMLIFIPLILALLVFSTCGAVITAGFIIGYQSLTATR